MLHGMTARSTDLFGDPAGAAPATPGSYGRPPSGTRLPDATRLGPVRLQVADLDRSLAFYEGILGLSVAARDDASARLTAHGRDEALIELVERPGARPASRGRLGLFHVAILLPDRAALGRLVRRLAEAGVRLGAGDHLVSEAFYLDDPDGLGLELYADRPRAAWTRAGRELRMGTDPVDVEELLEGAGDAPWRGMPPGTEIGHVHLHVGDLAAADAFYADGLGFDRTVWSYPGALFLAAGGYHHHLGVNTWAGSDARPARDDEARLLAWTIRVPDASDVDAVAAALAAAGHDATRDDADALIVEDPWGTRVRIAASPPPPRTPGPQRG
jgi:catechol 2,3-dioxygenase